MVWTISIDEWQKATGYLLDNTRRQHIDKPMLSCELGLNLHGVPTCFSCSGRIESPSPFPYVIIGSVEPERYEEVGQNLLQMLDMFYRVRRCDSAYGSRLVIQACGFSQYALVNTGSIVGLHDSSYLTGVYRFRCIPARLREMRKDMNYQFQDAIGRGGNATIYRGKDAHTGKAVAIKVLRDQLATDVKHVTRFQRQARATSKLQHPNIVQVYDYGQVDGNYYMVMELIEGTDLRHYLRARGVLNTERAIIIAHDVALGLGTAHDSSIVHGNVNTQNILVDRSGTIKLTSFCGISLGSQTYYSPEQLQGNDLAPATDVYALGIIMYEMLTGRVPFDGDTPVEIAMKHIHEVPDPPSQFNPNIPQAVENIIMKCLEKAPDKRYQNGSKLAQALQDL